jgi:hypothetical protein
MISGPELPRRAVLLALLASPAWAQRALAQRSWGLPQLMTWLAATRSGSASFTERETSPVLSAPLISTGTLSYVAPGYLRKQTSMPVPSIFTLQDGQVTLTQGGATRHFALDEDPRIAGLVEAIRGTLAGDLPSLQRFYAITLTGAPDAWQMTLVPRDPALARFLRAVIIEGAQGQVTLIDTQSADGGESRMSIAPAAISDAP